MVILGSLSLVIGDYPMSQFKPTDTEAYLSYLDRIGEMDLGPDVSRLAYQASSMIWSLNETLKLEADVIPECEL
tara:strand:+ start:159 stop:380 length:222 start_codon:yes stop_codon:yes gene_type:complete